MILSRERISRYMRHIIMPEISGPGQKKLLDSSVVVFGQNVDDAAALLYYLAASGVGHIYCHFQNCKGFDELAENIHDLNSDVILELCYLNKCGYSIIVGDPNFIKRNADTILVDFVPTVIAVHNGWVGSIQAFNDINAANSFLSEFINICNVSSQNESAEEIDKVIFTQCLLGALCAFELIKLILGIGEGANGSLLFDLYSMNFRKLNMQDCKQPLEMLISQVHSAQPAADLGDKKVLIIGTGGLGSPAAYALSSSGVGTIGLVDYDIVEISNLNRQILHSTSRIGMPKVESAEAFLKKINPVLDIKTYNTMLSKENVFEIIKEYDVVIDGVDNLPARYLLNDACLFLGKPMIEAGVLRFDGSYMTIIPNKSSCYRCLFPEIPSPGSIPSCSETGVLGPVPGILGFIQAVEAYKLLSGIGELLDNMLLYFDGISSDFITAKLSKNPSCPLCGDYPSIHELQEYTYSCETGIDEDGN